jgi:hypothetical protein
VCPFPSLLTTTVIPTFPVFSPHPVTQTTASHRRALRARHCPSHVLRVTNVDFIKRRKRINMPSLSAGGRTSVEEGQMRKWRMRMRRHRMPARDIRHAYALEELFESALAAAGRDYVPFARSERDRPKRSRQFSSLAVAVKQRYFLLTRRHTTTVSSL